MPGARLPGGGQSWQTFGCPTASAAVRRACNMSGMAQRKQNYIIWKVPVILKAMRDLPGSFCKAVQKRYFGMTLTARLQLFPASTTKKTRGRFMRSEPVLGPANTLLACSPARTRSQAGSQGLGIQASLGKKDNCFKSCLRDNYFKSCLREFQHRQKLRGEVAVLQEITIK